MARRKKKKDDAPPIETYGDGIVARNKRASFDFELGERYEAGLSLMGSEVKMLRAGHADIADAWVAIEGSQAFAKGINIPELPGTHYGHEPKRARKLLLHRHQIDQLKRAVERQGATVVATLLYFRGGRAKLEIAVASGKRKVDKRHTVKAREADREAEAAIRDKGRW